MSYEAFRVGPSLNSNSPCRHTMMGFTGFGAIVRGPFSVYVGTEFEMFGSWWPGGDKKDEKTV